ncbi:MAG TPA: MBL fold metallo-hydrolase [Acidimicrobiia bacterium]|nr:MBL fold metallo-hydrolase [Acidimicrobiia bacterium]
MARLHQLNRRLFLWEVGKGAVALAVLGAGVACSGDDDPAPVTSPGEHDGVTGSSEAAAGDDRLVWKRAALGVVSAYVLVRGREAAIVDTGLQGSERQIGDAVTAAGRSWGDVRHVIVTHKHPDHAGSLAAVLGAASNATAWAGEADIASIESPRPLEAAADGAEVFGLRIVATPGHTPGHISVFDPGAKLLVSGDAINNGPDGVAGPNPQYTADMPTAKASVKKLAGLPFETILFGHGDPVQNAGRASVERLATTLG